MSGSVHPLDPNQMSAVRPDETVWLSASAGTGKTQVLASRVLRLLLQPDVSPSQILCLTFTKAGATEMAARINGTLAEWVRLPDIDLFARLEAIGAKADPATRNRARTLFAAVLDCPGGGLRIDTIHAFAQWLLAAFPEEASLTPGSRAMEDRDRVLLLRQVLANLLVEAERDPGGDRRLLEAASELSLRMGPEAVEAYLLDCAEAREAWIGPGGWQEPMRPRINQLLGLPADADRRILDELCCDAHFDVASLRHCRDANLAWKAKTGQEAAEFISYWLASEPALRRETLGKLRAIFFTQKGELRAQTSLEKIDPDYRRHVGRVSDCLVKLGETQALLDLADRLVPALRLGRAFALSWERAKLREGLIDFDDQIRAAAELLTHSDYAQWIGYRLDRRLDHILVDEAQDTNEAQWRIIRALTQEFFSGIGQRGDISRTLFVVGDYKQAIFGFQGTSPENFVAARDRFEAEMAGAAANSRLQRASLQPKTLQRVGLDRSFRTAQTVLDFVDRTIEKVGHESFGLEKRPEPHIGEHRPGYVAMWRPVGEQSDDPFEADAAEEGGEGWLSKPDRQMADRIAKQVRQWMRDGFPLVKARAPGEPPRRATPGDVMVLVRKRRELAGLIVARLYAAGVPVAGVDRLRLGAPLAVRDLMSALRFAAQPLDNLNLACLLTSPLLGWSQDQLLEHGYRDAAAPLWQHMRQNRHPKVATAVTQLAELLRRADFDPPQALLQWLLVGPWQGRRKLLARLGGEAADPIEELLNAAHAFAASATPSLVGFLNWFDAGEGELKREAGNSADMVRVMTVHGSKGLQAPIVVLADAAGNPRNRRGSTVSVPDSRDEQRLIPLPALRKEERVGRLAAVHDRYEREEEEEHWRLLYVAMTRAEEALFIGGALGAREKEPVAKSWYAKLRQLFGMNDWVPDAIWGDRLEWGDRPAMMGPPAKSAQLPLPEPLPGWLLRTPPVEPRPPKPLAPSALGEDSGADPPSPPGAPEAARRGVLVHKLLERLPDVAPADVAPDRRGELGAAWLARHAPGMDAAERAELLASALAVLADPRWSEIFAPGALAEVPIAATIGTRVVVGTIDRLLVSPGRIRFVDFKTARRPPETLAQVPVATLRQMAAYALALECAYPGRTVDGALLYTAAPRLIELPADLLARHKQALAERE